MRVRERRLRGYYVSPSGLVRVLWHCWWRGHRWSGYSNAMHFILIRCDTCEHYDARHDDPTGARFKRERDAIAGLRRLRL